MIVKRQIEEKLTYEYEIFYLNLMCTSRANIFAKSAEIETKKKMIRILRIKLQEERFATKVKAALLCENILDTCYRYLLEHEQITEADINRVVCNWIQELQG